MIREVTIPYGSEMKSVKLDGIFRAVVARAEASAKVVSPDLLVRAVERPLGKPPLRRFLEGSKRLVVVVNDATRRTPTAQILESISPYLEKTDFTLLIACGAHPEPTSSELAKILGKTYRTLKAKTVFHVSRRSEDMVYLGRSRRGTDFYLNRLAVDADRILVITSVEPHYFAGLMGGRKSFLPGISSYETIVQNHRLAFHKMARAFSLSRNPVNNDMLEIFRYLSPDKIFAIQALQDRNGGLAGVLSGDINETFFSLAQSARRLYGVKTGTRADILVSVVTDPGLSLYESRKAMSYGILGLRRGGILIVVSPCRRGLGKPEFFSPILESGSPHQLLRRTKRNFELGDQRLGKWAEAFLWGEIWLVSDLPDRPVSSAFLKPHHSVETAVREAIRLKGTNSKVTFLFGGTTTVPLCR